MSTSSTSTDSSTPRVITPDPKYNRSLELNRPELLCDITGAKCKDMLKLSREASAEALQTYAMLSRSIVPKSFRHQHALSMAESAVTVLQAQRNEADLHVRSLTAAVAEKATQRNLTDKDVRDHEIDIREWTKERTMQELLLDSANKQRNSVIEQLSEILRDTPRTILETLLWVPITQKRSYKPSQRSFRKNALDYYDAVRKVQAPYSEKFLEQVWDPVMHAWAPGVDMKAANILPYDMSKEVLRMIFGEDEGAEILCDIRNCLFLWTPLESAFDEGVFVIVPTEEINQGGPINYRLVLFKETFRTVRVSHSCGITWNDLDGTVLEFRNDCRLRQKFIYLNFISRIIAARKLHHDNPSRMRIERVSRAWISPGKWIRKSMISEVARVVDDHQIPEMLGEGTFDGNDGRDNPTNDELSRAAEGWVTEIFFRELFGRDEEDEDSDEEE